MNKNYKLLVIPFLLALGACSSSSDSNDDIGGNSSLEIKAVSGSMISLDGTYNICYPDGGGSGSTLEEITFSGSNFAQTKDVFTSSDCTGSSNESRVGGAISVLSTQEAITGWIDGQDDPTVAPTAMDNSGPLSDTESYTPLNITINGTPTGDYSNFPVGMSLVIFYIADDTGAMPILYRDDDRSSGSTLASTVDPLTKQ